MSVFLGLDIGTTSTIGVLIDAAGRILSRAARPVTLHAPHANWAEEDTGEWWRNVAEVVGELMAESGIPASEIAGAGVTGMLPAVVLVDEHGQALRRSIQQNDARAVEELATLRGRMDENDFLGRSGTGYSQQLVGPKLMWLKTHEPEIMRRARYVMGASDYITSCLTATVQVEHNWAIESGFVNVATGGYDDRLIAICEVDPALMPPIRASHERVGAITAKAAAHLGLNSGIPVVAGCADHVASAFACGASADGDLVIKFGGSADILLSSERRIVDRRLFIDYHIVPGMFFSNGCMAAGGNLLNWIIASFAGGEVLSAQRAELTMHQWLDRLAAPCETELLFLPYILGEKTPLMDPFARGTIVGLGLHHGLGDVWRAALEGIVFGMRHHVDVFTEHGISLGRVFASDGGAESDLWLQIAANVLECPVQHRRHPGSALGAAFVAAVGAGAMTDWSKISAYVETGRTLFPNPEAIPRYRHKYRLWRETYDRLKTLYPQIHMPGPSTVQPAADGYRQ